MNISQWIALAVVVAVALLVVRGFWRAGRRMARDLPEKGAHPSLANGHPLNRGGVNSAYTDKDGNL